MDPTTPRFRNSRLSNRFGRRVIAPVFLALLVVGLGASWSVRAGILPAEMVWLAPLLTNATEPGDSQESPSTESAGKLSEPETRAVNSLMYQNRDRERLLVHAKKQLSEGDVLAAMECLQKILDFEEDLFLWRKSDHKLVSLRSETSRLLENLDADDFARYQQSVDAEAGLLYRRAVRRSDPRLYEEVTRRYFHTIHGFRATHWCAIRWFDHGHFELAARAWESLIAHRYHQSRVTKRMRVKLQLARKLSRQSESSPKPLLRVADNNTYSVAASGSRSAVIPAMASEMTNRGLCSWTSFQGGSDRAETVSATTPFMNPDWVVRSGDEASPAMETVVKLWEEKRGQSLKSRATSLFPIVVGGNVVFRDFQGIRCIDRKTGELHWSYRCKTSLQSEIDRLNEKHGADGVKSSRSGNYVKVQAAYAGNSVLGLISSDGKRVYAVDDMVLNPSAPTPESSDAIDPRKCNELLALPLHPQNRSEVRPLWTAGGTGDTSSARRPALVGHFFRGPPLAVDGRLYAVTEHRNQMNLVALEAETGRLLWKQGLAFADDTFEIDDDRYRLACPIAFGEGVLVCPTQAGLLVGVDAVTGTLLWSYCYAEQLYGSTKRGWRDRFDKTWGSAGFPAAPKIHGRRVVLLPRQSQKVHCLDVRTGRRIWTAPREDGEYVGAVTKERVLVVGSRYCRGLDCDSGEVRWSARFGLPAGQGIYTGGRYLLPLESGRIATVQIQDGREVGLSGWRNSKRFANLAGGESSDLTSRLGVSENRLPAKWKTGNLVPAGDKVIASGPRGLIAFPQTGDLLHRDVRNRLVENPDDLSTRLLAAELQLNLGHWGAARSNLETVLSPDVLSSESSPQLRPYGAFLLRELLFRQLETEPNFARPLLEELASLASTPADRGRFLMRKADYQIRVGNPQGAWESVRALVELDYQSVLPWPRNPRHEITPRSYAAHLTKRIRRQWDSAERDRIERKVESACQRVLREGDADELQQFLALYDSWPQAAEVRQRLAEIARSRGEFHQAELAWLKNRESRDRAVVAEANHQLMDLWNQLGLHSEAASLAETLASPRFRSVPLKGGSRADEVLDQIPVQSLLGQAIERRSLPDYQVERVEISEQRWTPTGKALLDAFGKYRREFPLPPGNAYQLLDKDWKEENGDRDEIRVAVIDRDAGLIKGKVRIPQRNSYPSLSKRAHAGHFFPVGSVNAMIGVSLLEIDEEKPVWETQVGDETSHQQVLRAGLAGPGFCTFQGKEELLVLDPATGRTLWKRTDIDFSSGLVSDPYAGLFGDGEVLVLFNADRSSYTVYRTATGETLHHGELEIDTGKIRRIFGRKLFYITQTSQGRRMRIWDFGENRLIFDEPAGSRIYSGLTPNQNLIVLVPPESHEKPAEAECPKTSRLLVLDVVNDNVLLDFEVPAEELKNLNYLRAFQLGGTFYVNFQRSVKRSPHRLFSYYASDAFPPVENVQGDLLAVDPVNGEVRWKRELPQRSVLLMPHLRLPFLVTISRVRDRWQGGKQGLLVEVFDAETGETIAKKDNNLSDRIVNLACDREAGILDLNGLKTRIRLKFGPALAKIPLGDGPI